MVVAEEIFEIGEEGTAAVRVCRVVGPHERVGEDVLAQAIEGGLVADDVLGVAVVPNGSSGSRGVMGAIEPCAGVGKGTRQ